MTANYKHIRFEEYAGAVLCRSNHGNTLLGSVAWMTRWREYEYVPEPNTGYTVECVRDIADFLAKMNAERKG